MADFFISYSRKDEEFVVDLVRRLDASGREAWRDRDTEIGIPPAAEWLPEIRTAIEATNVFVPVITPDFLTSVVCGQEVQHAVDRKKRIIPLLHKEAPNGAVHVELAKLNWIFVRAEDDLDNAIRLIQSALDTDLEWVREHTRLLRRAVDWDAKNRDPSYLLRGSDLKAFERWLARAPGKEPQPAVLQVDYIVASRKAATRRERQVIGGVAFGVLVAAVLSVVAYFTELERSRQEQIAAARQLINLSEERQQTPRSAPDVAEARRASLLPAVQALAEFARLGVPTIDADQAVRRALGQPLPIQQWELGLGELRAVAFDPTGRFVAAADTLDELRVWDLEQSQPMASWKEEPRAGATTIGLALNSTATHLVSARYDSDPRIGATTLTLWRLPSTERVAELVVPGRADGTLYLHPAATSVHMLKLGETFVWDVATSAQGSALIPNSIVYGLAYSPDAQRVAIVFRLRGLPAEYKLRVANAATGVSLFEQPLAGRPIFGNAVTWNEDGSQVTVALTNSLVHVNAASGAPVGHATAQEPKYFSTDGNRFAFLLDNTYGVLVSQLADGQELLLPVAAEVKAAAFQRGRATLATVAIGDEGIVLWPLQPADYVAELEHAGDVTALNPDSAARLLTVWSSDSSACWELPTGAAGFRQYALTPRPCPESSLKALAFEIDESGRSARVVDDDGKRRWEHEFPSKVLGGAVAGDGASVAVMLQIEQTRGGEPFAVERWDIAQQQKLNRLEHPSLVVRFNESPIIGSSHDGQLAVLQNNDGLAVWDVRRAKVVSQILLRNVTAAIFDETATRLALATNNGDIRVFALPRGEEMARVKFDRPVVRMGWSSDGRWLAAAGADRKIRLWTVAPDALIAQACVHLATECP